MSRIRFPYSIHAYFMALSPCVPSPTPPGSSPDYLTGLRGLLVVESFTYLWVQTFVPAAIFYTVPGPFYQAVLRKTLSVLFWDQSLIFSFYIILSARTCCIRFLGDPSSSAFARSLITRPLRVGASVSIAMAMSIVVFSHIDTSYIDDAALLINNPSIKTPMKPATPLAAFNTIYDLLWVVRDFPGQAGNQAWPSRSMWAPSLIYSQTYTVYIAMMILPFTRASWHIKGLLLFSLGSFWFNSWGWFSAAGLLIADFSLNPAFRGKTQTGLRVHEDLYLPYWIVTLLPILAGLVMKYTWTAAFPQFANFALVLHPCLDGLSGDNDWRVFDTTYPYPRLDNYLVAVGTLTLLELSDRLQVVLSANFLVFLGKRSLSVFTTQALLVYTLGLKLFLQLHVVRGMSIAGTNLIVLVTLLPATLLAGEVFHRLVDHPSTRLAAFFYQFLTR